MIAKCDCQHCGNPVEFEAEHTGEPVACPHCGKMMVLDQRLPEIIAPPAFHLEYVRELKARRANLWKKIGLWTFVVATVALGLFFLAQMLSEEPGVKKEAGSLFSVLAFFGAIALAGAIYFLPAIVGRHKRNSSAIMVLNLFLGWTFIGWVVALVWANTVDPEQA